MAHWMPPNLLFFQHQIMNDWQQIFDEFHMNIVTGQLPMIDSVPIEGQELTAP